jgi:choloylglycine hydrolase
MRASQAKGKLKIINMLIKFTTQGPLSWPGAIAVGIFLIFPAPVTACSLFFIARDDEVVYGQNLDWHTPFPGHVIVNPRGLVKNVVPWKGSWPNPRGAGTKSWVSRYGSVTLTCYGRGFIEGGMNEAGLIVDEASLWAVYPSEDDRPGISCPQWMQYQLDNYATVEEVIAHLDDLRPDGEGWHYLITDPSGACAVIEYPDGKPAVYRGETAPVCALTNTTYEQALSHVPMDKAFGGEVDIASGSDSYGRFVLIARFLRDYDPQRDGTGDAYAFRVLDAVSYDQTLRSVVYDAGRRRMLWRTPGNPQIRWLDLTAFDFDSGLAAQSVDIEAGSGNVDTLLSDFSREANETLVEAVLGPSFQDSAVIEELKRRGLSVERTRHLIADPPIRGRAGGGE